ncbi:S1C family serine protease [Antribacter gilvus]|uniref:S1C family serine protease n=1 Tax=Antribacter gilvus TaxID=2304675 RepID=UPI000F77C611|nr:trypsin-like peptidase domain-containing protein [Antribacter gilvus]
MTEHTPFAPPTPPRPQVPHAGNPLDAEVPATGAPGLEAPAVPAAVPAGGEVPGGSRDGSVWTVTAPAQEPAHGPDLAAEPAAPARADVVPGDRGGARPGLGARGGVAVVVLGLLAGALGGTGAYSFLDWRDGSRPAEANLPVPVGGGTVVDRPAGTVAAIAEQVLPSVVSIQVQAAQGVATGSGMVLKEDGYILTNNHVVAEAGSGAQIIVGFSDGHELPATMVGATADYDLAVIKVDEAGLVPLILGNSDEVVVGDSVLAVGSPLGLDATVTTGIVSALHRPVKAGEDAEAAFIDAIQTDAAINPGNSGGPLVNAAGEVIGINSAIAQPPGTSAATGNIGLGFAIPSNQARHTAEQLIETGKATFPVIGVLLDPTYQGEGVRVSTEAVQGQPPVSPGGPADQAGIRAGDVILSIDGRPVSVTDELIVAIRAKAPGDPVTLRVRSDDDERDVRVVLDERTSG